jgi:hypothetical protein
MRDTQNVWCQNNGESTSRKQSHLGQCWQEWFRHFIESETNFVFRGPFDVVSQDISRNSEVLDSQHTLRDSDSDKDLCWRNFARTFNDRTTTVCAMAAESDKKKDPRAWDGLTPPLAEWILDAIAAMGFGRMTPVQASTIPLFLGNKDVVVEVQLVYWLSSIWLTFLGCHW